MVLLVAWVQLGNFFELCLDYFLSLVWQYKVVELLCELLNLGKFSAFPATAAVSAVEAALRKCGDTDAGVVLFALSRVVGFRALHKVLDAVVLPIQDVIEKLEPLIEAVELEDGLPLLAGLVPNHVCNQEQHVHILFLFPSLTDADGHRQQGSALGLGQGSIHIKQF